MYIIVFVYITIVTVHLTVLFSFIAGGICKQYMSEGICKQYMSEGISKQEITGEWGYLYKIHVWAYL